VSGVRAGRRLYGAQRLLGLPGQGHLPVGVAAGQGGPQPRQAVASSSSRNLVYRAPSHKTLGNVELLAEVVGEGITGAVDDPIGHVLLGEEPPLEPKAAGDLAACHFPLEPGENLAKAKPGIRQETTALAV